MEGCLALLAWDRRAEAPRQAHRPDRDVPRHGVLRRPGDRVVDASRRQQHVHRHGAAVGRASAAQCVPRELDRVAGEMAALPVWNDRSQEPTLVGADGREDFRHFWLYPLVAAPVLAVVRATGLHWNHAFTIVNIALLGVFAWCAVSTLEPARRSFWRAVR